MSKNIFAAAVTAALTVAAGRGASAETIKIFNDGASGAGPYAGLIADASGNLYGTAVVGGATCKDDPLGCGTVFRLSPPSAAGKAWTTTVLHTFQSNGVDGEFPYAALVADASGNLYSTTQGGGQDGSGTVFELSPPKRPGGKWQETILCSFPSSCPGRAPVAALIFDTAGNLYGTAQSGGSNGGGTVFRLSPPASEGASWTPTELYSFAVSGSAGKQPIAGVVMDKQGNLYGMTEYGGSNQGSGCGVVFSLSPPASGTGSWTETNLHVFDTGSDYDGCNPVAPLVLSNHGDLLGTTPYWLNGPGAVFELTAPGKGQTAWTYQPIHVFTAGTSDGDTPNAALVAAPDGAYYGTTIAGGKGTCNNGLGCGTVFKVSPPGKGETAWSEKTVYRFSPSVHAGNSPYAPVMFGPAGLLYGTTANGGGSTKCGFGCGTAFAVKP